MLDSHHPSAGGLLAGAMFLFLSFMIGVGALRMAKSWDEPETHR